MYECVWMVKAMKDIMIMKMKKTWYVNDEFRLCGSWDNDSICGMKTRRRGEEGIQTQEKDSDPCQWEEDWELRKRPVEEMKHVWPVTQ